LIPEWAIQNSIISSSKLVEELKTQARLFGFIPVERGLDI
jgi:hypothetical protein